MPSISPSVRGSRLYFVFFGSLAAWYPFINIYFRQRGLSGWEIGLLSALMPAGTLLLAAPLTAMTDRRGAHLATLAVLTVGMGSTLLIVSLPTSFSAFFALLALLAAFYSATIPIIDSTVAGMASRYGLNYGGMRLWGSFGYAIVAVICGALWQRFGYRPMFGVAAALYLVSAWFGRSLDHSPAVHRRDRVSFRTLGGDRFVLLVLVATFLISIALGMDMTFAGVYMTHLGGEGFFVGLLFGLSAMFELPAMQFTARLNEAIGGPLCLLAAYMMFGLAYLGYALAPNPGVMIGFSVFRGLGFGLFYATTVKVLAQRTPAAWSGAIQGVMNMIAFGLAQLVARLLSGVIYDAIGPPAVFVAATFAAVAAALLMAAVTVWQPFHQYVFGDRLSTNTDDAGAESEYGGGTITKG